MHSADPFVQLWQDIMGTVMAVANEFDRQWQQRRRVLNTVLVMLFVFRLVFSKNKQGYATTIAELWEQCRVLGVALPQAKPVSASALCAARAKLDEQAFKQLHQRILSHHHSAVAPSLWLGHRLFAVDGSKINLPRQLLKHGYRTPTDNAYYPQGLLSCLYQLESKIPTDFDLVSHRDEAKVARTHLVSLRNNDVVVYDRGYFSYAMLYEHVHRDLHPIFRIRRKARHVINEFIVGQQTDAIVEILPSKEGRAAIEQAHPGCPCSPLSLRLVKYSVGGSTYVLGTTLFDRHKYPIEQLAQVYHARWGIEELYKISKQLICVEDFHGQSERGVKQELFAHFVLITMARIFSNHSETELGSRGGAQQPPRQINFKNCLTTVARNIEALVIRQATLLTETINRIVASIASCHRKRRPGRSYERRSRKPAAKWMPIKPSKYAKLIDTDCVITGS